MTLTAGVITALDAATYRPEQFCKIEFPGYTFLVWTSTYPYTLDGDAYTPVGSLGSIGPISDVSDLQAQGFELKLTGLDAALMAELRDFTHQGSVVTIQEGLFDANLVLIPDPYTIAAGIVDTMSFNADPQGGELEISVSVQTIARMLLRGPDGGRRMQAQQTDIYPGDLGLEFGNAIKEDVTWGVPVKLPKGGAVILRGIIFYGKRPS